MMRCLFCKLDSSRSRSTEHVIPESLGNHRHVLRPGVVCDACNNYFSREVEKQFLELAPIYLLRFHQGVPSKKGRVPRTEGLIFPARVPVEVSREPFPNHQGIHLYLSENVADQITKLKTGRLYLPGSGGMLPDNLVVSRFFAKIALEAMAERLENHPDGLDYLVKEKQLDLIRNHARRGDTHKWPVHQRRIYDQDAKWVDESGQEVQVVHEFDILPTRHGEWYFVIALFGAEFAINYAGPEIDGYQQWLSEHAHISPLYSGKNSVATRLVLAD